MDIKITSILDDWYKNEIGKALLKTELNALSSILPKIFGYYLVLAGEQSCEQEIFSSSKIHNHIIINPPATILGHQTAINCNLSNLPFLPESIDAMVLFHALEFHRKPETVIHECYDSLINGGYLIILGFNPRSLWGINKFFKTKKKSKSIWKGKWISPTKLKKWLTTTGFEVGDYQTFYFRPYSKHPDKLLMLEGIGQIFWPYGGAGYLLVAHKTSPLVNPLSELKILPEQAKIVNRVPKPTSRSIQ